MRAVVEPDLTAEREAGVVWRSAAEIALLEPERPDYVVTPYVARGSITEVEGKIKVGKTTFIMAMVHAVLVGCPFLDRPTNRGAVVYLTGYRR